MAKHLISYFLSSKSILVKIGHCRNYNFLIFKWRAVDFDLVLILIGFIKSFQIVKMTKKLMCWKVNRFQTENGHHKEEYKAALKTVNKELYDVLVFQETSGQIEIADLERVLPEYQIFYKMGTKRCWDLVTMVRKELKAEVVDSECNTRDGVFLPVKVWLNGTNKQPVLHTMFCLFIRLLNGYYFWTNIF